MQWRMLCDLGPDSCSVALLLHDCGSIPTLQLWTCELVIYASTALLHTVNSLRLRAYSVIVPMLHAPWWWYKIITWNVFRTKPTEGVHRACCDVLTAESSSANSKEYATQHVLRKAFVRISQFFLRTNMRQNSKMPELEPTVVLGFVSLWPLSPSDSVMNLNFKRSKTSWNVETKKQRAMP